VSSILDAIRGNASPSEINAYSVGGPSYLSAYTQLAQMSPANLSTLTSRYATPQQWLQANGWAPDMVAKVPTTWDAIVGPTGNLSQPTGVPPGPGYTGSGQSTPPPTTTTPPTTTGAGTDVRGPNNRGLGGITTAPVVGGPMAPRSVGTWQPPTSPANYAGLTAQGRMGYVDPFQNYNSVATPQMSGVNQTGTQINYTPMPKPTATTPPPRVSVPGYTPSGGIDSVGPGDPLHPPGSTTTPPPTGTTPPPPTGTTPPTTPPVVTRPGTGSVPKIMSVTAKEDEGNGAVIDGTVSDGHASTTTSSSSNPDAATTDPYQWTIWNPQTNGHADIPFTQQYGGHGAPFSSLSDQIAKSWAGFNVYNPLSWAQIGNPSMFQGRPATLGPAANPNVMPFVR
jgi:hypothetical protein